MFELLGGGLLGSIFGGLFRLAPEVLKFLDKKNERQHELSMFQLQTDLEKMRGEFKMEEKYVDYSIQQMDTIKAAFKEQLMNHINELQVKVRLLEERERIKGAK